VADRCSDQPGDHPIQQRWRHRGGTAERHNTRRGLGCGRADQAVEAIDVTSTVRPGGVERVEPGGDGRPGSLGDRPDDESTASTGPVSGRSAADPPAQDGGAGRFASSAGGRCARDDSRPAGELGSRRYTRQHLLADDPARRDESWPSAQHGSRRHARQHLLADDRA
jgi:hypothetical protein